MLRQVNPHPGYGKMCGSGKYILCGDTDFKLKPDNNFWNGIELVRLKMEVMEEYNT